jgi:hypothetical protein
MCSLFFIIHMNFLYSSNRAKAIHKRLIVTPQEAWHHESLLARVLAIRKWQDATFFDAVCCGKTPTALPTVYKAVTRIVIFSIHGDLFVSAQQKVSGALLFNRVIGYVGITAHATSEYDWENVHQSSWSRRFHIHPTTSNSAVEHCGYFSKACRACQ